MFIIKKKGQAALEFLMTYGWAILVVLVAIGALAYFGVLSPSTFLPERCFLPPGMACVDYNVGSSEAVFILQNSFGKDMTVNSVTLLQEDGTSCVENVPFNIPDGRKYLVTITGCTNGVVGSRFKADILIDYQISGQVAHVFEGDIIAEIQSGTVTTSQGVCQNAQDLGLCTGLNITYGDGYQQKCCSEHTLCC